MANVNGTNYAKSINPTQSNRNDPGAVGGRVRSLTEVIELAAQPANDTINIGKDLADGAIIHGIQINNDTLGAGVLLDIGDSDQVDRYINGYDAEANESNQGGVSPVTGEMAVDGIHYVIGTNVGDRTILVTILIAAATGTLKITVYYSED